MPPGSRKRKSVKKKKEIGTPNNNPGNDEVKSQDSDGEEFSTPAIGFHQTSFDAGEFCTPAVDFHQTPFQMGGDELEKTSSSSVGSFLTESKSMDQSTPNGESFVEAVPDLESPGSAESKTTGSRDNESRGEGFGNLVSKEVGKLKEIATVGGNALVSDVVKPVVSVSVGLARVKEYAPTDSSAALDPIGSVLKENGEKLMAKFGELTRTSPTAADAQSKNNGEASSNAVKFAPEDSEDKAVSSLHPNGAEHNKKPEAPQSPENEPLLPVAPRRAQTTSWKSCCGLFEVFTGSNRSFQKCAREGASADE